jgi:cell filamentation protein
MSGRDYEVFDDPYCYRGTFVLKNRAGVKDPKRLEAFELEMSTLRAEEPLPNGRFGQAHYCAVHKHLFGDVYTWAGRYRTVRTSKGGNTFCYPEYIDLEMAKLFARLGNGALFKSESAREFTKDASIFLAQLNAIHAFREGNGRAQLAFLHLISLRAGYPLDLKKLRPGPFLDAMIKSFHGSTGGLEAELRRLL